MLKEIMKAETLSELKIVYRKWIMKVHPDLGGSTEETQQLNAAYEKRFKEVKAREMGKEKGEREFFNYNENPQDMVEIIDELIKLHGIQIDIVGNWIWLSGNTKAHKERLKELHFFWSSAKKMWYWNGDKVKKNRRGQKTYKQITEMYGCKTIKTEERKAVTA